MSVNSKAFEMAKSGASNADIFGAIELTSSALSAMQNTDPSLIFHILQGRYIFAQELISKTQDLALGWDDAQGPKPNLSALLALIDRADKQSTALVASYEILLLAGTSFSKKAEKLPAQTVTKMLRVQ